MIRTPWWTKHRIGLSTRWLRLRMSTCQLESHTKTISGKSIAPGKKVRARSRNQESRNILSHLRYSTKPSLENHYKWSVVPKSWVSGKLISALWNGLRVMYGWQRTLRSLLVPSLPISMWSCSKTRRSSGRKVQNELPIWPFYQTKIKYYSFSRCITHRIATADLQIPASLECDPFTQVRPQKAVSNRFK